MFSSPEAWQAIGSQKSNVGWVQAGCFADIAFLRANKNTFALFSAPKPRPSE